MSNNANNGEQLSCLRTPCAVTFRAASSEIGARPVAFARMKVFAFAPLVFVIACTKEPPAACTTLSDKEWSCHPGQGKRKRNTTDDRLCVDAFASEVPAEGIERLGALRFRHDAACAESSATCEAFDQCKERFDLAGAVTK